MLSILTWVTIDLFSLKAINTRLRQSVRTQSFYTNCDCKNRLFDLSISFSFFAFEPHLLCLGYTDRWTPRGWFLSSVVYAICAFDWGEKSFAIPAPRATIICGDNKCLGRYLLKKKKHWHVDSVNAHNSKHWIILIVAHIEIN